MSSSDGVEKSCGEPAGKVGEYRTKCAVEQHKDHEQVHVHEKGTDFIFKLAFA